MFTGIVEEIGTLRGIRPGADSVVLDIAAAGRAVGVRTVMISNGYVQEQPLADLCREIAAYKVDLKGFDAGFFERHTGGDLKHVLETLRRLRKHGTWTEIVALVIPTQNDSEAEARALARFVRDRLEAVVLVRLEA